MRRLAQCRRMTAPDRRIAAFVWTCLLLATLAGLSLWAILAGPFPLSFSDLPTLSPAQHSVLFNLRLPRLVARSEEHTSELQSLMRISYAVFCLKKKKDIK